MHNAFDNLFMFMCLWTRQLHLINVFSAATDTVAPSPSPSTNSYNPTPTSSPLHGVPPSDHIVPHHTTDKSELFFGEGGLILWLFDYRKQTQPLAHSTLKGSWTCSCMLTRWLMVNFLNPRTRGRTQLPLCGTPCPWTYRFLRGQCGEGEMWWDWW